jgi:hypothetical protein
MSSPESHTPPSPSTIPFRTPSFLYSCALSHSSFQLCALSFPFSSPLSHRPVPLLLGHVRAHAPSYLP